MVLVRVSAMCMVGRHLLPSWIHLKCIQMLAGDWESCCHIVLHSPSHQRMVQSLSKSLKVPEVMEGNQKCTKVHLQKPSVYFHKPNAIKHLILVGEIIEKELAP